MSSRAAQVSQNLPLLQNQIKRDPTSYREEFLQQYHHFHAVLETFKLNPNHNCEQLVQLVAFISQVCGCFPNLTKEFPKELVDTLSKMGQLFPSELRIKLCRSLVLLRSKGLIDELSVLHLFFELFQCRDKELRKFLFVSTVGHIKRLWTKAKNRKTNMAVQQYILAKISDSEHRVGRNALLLAISLYRKNIWNDAKTVNTVAAACFSQNVKVMVTGLKFFLNATNEDEDEEDQADDSDNEPEESKKSMKAVLLAYRVGKKSKKRKKQMQRAKDTLQKEKPKKNMNNKTINFSALQLIYDPQEFAEKLLKRLDSSNDRFEVKLLLMALVARCIGIHQLQLLNFYPFLQKYLQPHQRDVTKILLCAAQATHEMVPPEVIESVVRTIVNNFVTERNSAEVITVGLNAVREICYGCPLAMGEDLLQDLTQYKTYKNKNVFMAARSLITLFRTINPSLLNRRDRGRPTQFTKELKPRIYGEQDVKTAVPGSEKISLTSTVEATDSGNSGSDESDMSDEDEDFEDVSSGSDDEDEEIVATDQEPSDSTATDNSARIFTQEEFEKMEAIQLAKRIAPTKRGKRPAEADESDERGLLTKLSNIEKLYKRAKQTREEKIATVKEGRDGREEFGRPKPRGPHVGKTNKKAKRNKSFMMVKYKQKGKTKRSFRDKQMALKKHLTTLKKAK